MALPAAIGARRPTWLAGSLAQASIFGRQAAWKAALFVLPLAISILALAGCAAEGESPCKDDHRCLRYALSSDIPVLDPHVSDLPEAGIVFRQIYDTLVYRESGGDFVPGLASAWQISPDGLVYTFFLRQDVTFHDGAPFRAAAVAANIERIFHPHSPVSLARELLGPLRQFEIVDEYTIRLRLFEPYPALLDGLSQPYLGIAGPDALASNEDLRYQFHQSGTGPFVLESYLPGDSILLRRFGEYLVRPSIYPPLAGDEIERIEFSILGNLDADLLSSLASHVDVIDDVSPVAAQSLAGNSRVALLPTSIPGQTVQFVFNTSRAHLSDRDVRLALLLATNRAAISDLLYFNALPVGWAPLAESSGYAHTGFINQYEYSLDEAQAVLTAAGYADGDGDGILDRSGAALALTIVAPPWGRLADVAEFLKDQWRLIGVDLNVEPTPGRSRLNALIRSGEYDLLPVGNFGMDPGILGRVFLDQSPYSASRAQHPALNDLLLRAAQEMDPTLRRSRYYEIQSLLMNEVLILPISEPVRLRAISADVADLRFDAYGFYPLLHNVRIAES